MDVFEVVVAAIICATVTVCWAMWLIARRCNEVIRYKEFVADDDTAIHLAEDKTGEWPKQPD